MAYAGELSALISDYRDRGRREAAEHRPPTDAPVPDIHENELRAAGESYVRVEELQFRNKVAEAEKSETNIREELQNLRNEVRSLVGDSSFKSDAEVEMANERKAIEELAEGRIRAEVQLRDFRFKNHVTEEAHYPESHVWHFGIVALCFLFETTANAFFFSNSVSLLEGYGFAVGIALVNIATAMLLGVLFRYKNVDDPTKKRAGWLCLVVFVAATIWLNALFAAYRTEYELLTNPEDWAQLSRAFETALGQATGIFILQMHIRDLTSFLLFGFGLLLSGLAFFKGYTIDDKYPEHGRMHRLVRAERTKENDAIKSLKAKLSQTVLAHRAKVQSAINSPQDLLRRVSASQAQLTKSRSELSHQVNTIQSDHKRVLEEYRQTNAKIRGIPTPQYFASIEPLAVSERLEAISDGVATRLNELQIELEVLRDENQSPLLAKLEEVHQYHSFVQDGGLTTYTNQVVRDAQDRIAASALAIAPLDIQAAR